MEITPHLDVAKVRVVLHYISQCFILPSEESMYTITLRS